MKTLTLHRVDRWDGGERHNPTRFHFTDKEDAETQMGKHDRITSMSFVILEPGDTLTEAERHDAAVRVLERMSPADREAIGLARDLQEAIDNVTRSVSSPHS